MAPVASLMRILVENPRIVRLFEDVGLACFGAESERGECRHGLMMLLFRFPLVCERNKRGKGITI